MDHKFDFGDGSEEQIVYVRPVPEDELPDDLRGQIDRSEPIYALHDAEGQRLALVASRALGFVLARQNEMNPVNVH